MEKIEWTIGEYNERIALMLSIGLTEDQICYILECVTIVSNKPVFSIHEE